MKHIMIEQKKNFIFLTLTASNVKGDKLGERITDFNKAFKELMRQKEVMSVVKGFVRKLEVTYNADRDDFHPHFHVLIAVDRSYFKNKDYINHEKWLQMWQEVMKDFSITQVDVRKFKGDTAKEVLEVATYAAKDSDLYHNEEVFDYYYKALKGRQILTYGGLFAEANKLYKAGTLDYLKDVDTTEYVYMLLYKWGMGEYIEKERRELTEDERKKVNRELINESEIESEKVKEESEAVEETKKVLICIEGAEVKVMENFGQSVGIAKFLQMKKDIVNKDDRADSG